ncbi:hypothetical protein [Sphingobacterium thermophilum]|uniref:Glycoside hydrolase n=1 Tax=Sphingobacterium thermophilum TaxID=768534 RepID=A0ABP8QVX0_9SPHI
MKKNNNIYKILALSFFVLSLMMGCKENELVFPEQIPADEIEVTERGPVKQNGFTVITIDDEKVKFDLSTVDVETVESIFFSHNRAGVQEVTEVKNFQELYIIENLPVGMPTAIEVWAKGKNGLESKKYTYSVSPLPYPARGLANNISIEGGIKSVVFFMLNLSRANATLYYKIDDAATFTEVDMPTPTPGVNFEVKGLAPGLHTVSYYVADENGGQSEIKTAQIDVLEPPLINYNTAELRAGWTPYASNSNSLQEGPPTFMLDANPNTIWHTQWLTTITSNHRPDQKYPFTLIFTFTETRAASPSGLYDEEFLKNPAGPYKPILIKEVTLLHRAVNNYRVKDIELYGIKEDGTEVKLGDYTLSNTQQKNVISLADNETFFKAVKIICLTTFHPTDQFANFNEIFIKGYEVY